MFAILGFFRFFDLRFSLRFLWFLLDKNSTKLYKIPQKYEKYLKNHT